MNRLLKEPLLVFILLWIIFKLEVLCFFGVEIAVLVRVFEQQLLNGGIKASLFSKNCYDDDSYRCRLYRGKAGIILFKRLVDLGKFFLENVRFIFLYMLALGESSKSFIYPR